MAVLKPLASKGKGKVAILLPKTVTSPRYHQYDAPDLTKALTTAGLTHSQVAVYYSRSDAGEFGSAKAAIAKGARVLIVDPLDSGVGVQIESYANAKKRHIRVIDYDRLTLGGSRSYYVSFDDVQVGALLGAGLATCISTWHVAKPHVLVMYGAPTDNQATLFAQGYKAVLGTYFRSRKWTQTGKLAMRAGTWDPPIALNDFRQQFRAHPNINAALIPNDENAAPIIWYLKHKGIKARTFPLTGQDATPTGLQNILAGYQCGTIYKPIYREAQAAAALAMYLRAGVGPPRALVNGSVMDTTSNVSVPSVLVTPTWVTTANMNATVIADCLVLPAKLCAGILKAACTTAGIPASCPGTTRSARS
jgi:D-xylose transport system substrate-binding protein